jgi:1-acyl-sn-glycerol-3-phosphate acyltransferase
MRMTLRIAAMLAGLILCLPGHYAWRLLRLSSPWPRIFLGWVGRCAGARVRVSGRPLSSHVLFVSNHSSWLDIMVLAGATGTTFVSKQEVADSLLFGWLARINQTVFVARAARGTVHDQASALRTALASGRPVALFPEGTTDGGTTVLSFRASLLAAVVPPPGDVSVQPVAIDYGAAAGEIAWVAGEKGADNIRRLLSRRGDLPVALHFLEPIDPAAMADRKTLASVSRSAIVATLDASARSGDTL